MDTDSRSAVRSLCADLVSVEWKDDDGWVHELSAVLEDISEQGACLQVESPIPPYSDLLIRHDGTALFSGHSIYCVGRDAGFFVGMVYEPGVVWSKRTFMPSHLLDLQELASRNMGSKN